MTFPVKACRCAAIAMAVLFIGLSLCGIAGAWFINRKATDAALHAFGLVETATGVVEAGVTRVNDLITAGRTEMNQAFETIAAVGARAEPNAPVLTALSERLETRLTPRIAQIRQALEPVRDAVVRIGNAVSMVNSLPMMAERAPRLEALDEAFHRLEALAADTTQLRGTLQSLVAERKGDAAVETVVALTGIAQRIETRLNEVQTGVQGMQADIAELQARQGARKSRVLFVFNLAALLLSLLLLWVLYSQIVVIRHHRAHLRRPAA
jgi:hypothetical protein